MFIHQPDDFSRVNRRTAAKRDNNVGLKRIDQIQRLMDGRQVGIRMNVGEYLKTDADFFQNVRNRPRITKVEQWLVRNNKGFFAPFEFAQGMRQATGLEVDFRRNLEPQHVFLTHCNCLNVHQMFNSQVSADRVAAPRAAAQSQRRFQNKVVQVAECALRRRAVDDDARRRNQFAVMRNSVMIVGIGVKHGRMSGTAEHDQRLGLGCRFVEVFCLVHSQNRRKLFGRERFFRSDFADFGNQHFSIGRNLNAGHLGNGGRPLSDDVGVDVSVFEQHFAEGFLFLFVKKISAAGNELFFDGVVNVLNDDNRLFGSANHAVVKGFGNQH